ncbi:MAG: tetratricopeptide repeat protein [Candidatus Hodarchaeota archaeon]
MFDVANQLLSEAERLFSEEKFDQVLQVLSTMKKKQNLSSEDWLCSQILKARALGALGRSKEILEFVESALMMSQKLNIPTRELELYDIMSTTLFTLGNHEEAIYKAEQAEYRIKMLDEEPALEILRSKGSLLHTKGTSYMVQGQLEQGERALSQALTLRRKIKDKYGTADSLAHTGVLHILKGKINQGIEFLKQGLELFKELKNNEGTAKCIHNIAWAYSLKGELDRSLDYNQQSLAFAEQIGNQQHIANSLQSIGETYQRKGNLDQALKYMQKALKLKKRIGNNFWIAFTLHPLIELCVDNNLFDLAHQYLQDFETLDSSREELNVNHKLRLCKAITLRANRSKDSDLSVLGFSSLHRVLERYVKSQTLLRDLIAEQVVDHNVTSSAIFNLCELLLVELKTLGNEDVLTEVNVLSDQLIRIAQDQNVYPLLAKSYLLKAKLALLKPAPDQTRDLLSKAQAIAQEKGYDRLALVISNEQKQLAGDLPNWILEENFSLSDRINKIRLESLVVSLRQNRVESYTGEMPDRPTMDELTAFAQQLDKRKFEW